MRWRGEPSVSAADILSFLPLSFFFMFAVALHLPCIKHYRII
jgi:hypothetical protein